MSPGRRLHRVLLVTCLGAWVVQSLFFVFALITDGDAEGVYLYHGYLAVTGQISLYQDEMTGHRMPLPYYVIGLSQALWKPSLVAARIVAATLGLATIILLWRLAARIGGAWCGVLTLLFAVTQSYLTGYFAWATFHSLISLLLTGGLFVLLGTDLRGKRIAAMVFSTLVFFTRPQIMPLQLLAWAYLVWTAKGRAERAAITAVAVIPPVLFFVVDLNHVKLLSWIGLGGDLVPGLSGLLASLGFRAPAIPYRLESVASGTVGAAIVLARAYKAWGLGAAMLIGWIAWRAIRKESVKEFFSDRRITTVVVVLLYLAAWQLLVVRYSLTAAVGYFSSFMMLAALPLGYGFTVMLRQSARRGGLRRAVVALVALLLLLGPAASPPPALPLAVALERPAMVAQQEAVARLRSLVPAGSRVFLYGASETPFMAGLRPYVQQANFLETLSPMSDAWVRHRSGLWGDAEIRAWLGHEVDYAVINLEGLRAIREIQYTPAGNNVDLIEALLAQSFRLIAVLDPMAGPRLSVYERVRRTTR